MSTQRINIMRNNLKQSWVLAKNTGEIVNSYIQKMYKNRQYEKATNMRNDGGSAKPSKERIESQGPIRTFRAQHQETERAIKKSGSQARRVPKSETGHKQLGLLSTFVNSRKLSKPAYRVNFRRLSSSSLSSLRRRLEDRMHHSQFPMEPQYNELHSFCGPAGPNINYVMNMAMSKYLQPVRNQHMVSHLGSIETAIDVSAKIQKDLMDVDIGGHSPRGGHPKAGHSKTRKRRSPEKQGHLAVPFLSQQDERYLSGGELLQKYRRLRELTESRHNYSGKGGRDQSALLMSASEQSIGQRKRLSEDYQRAARETRPRIERIFKSQTLMAQHKAPPPPPPMGATKSALLTPSRDDSPTMRPLYESEWAKQHSKAKKQQSRQLEAAPKAPEKSDQAPGNSALRSLKKSGDYQRDFEERQKEFNIRKSNAAMKSVSGTVMRPAKPSDGLDRSASSTGVRQITNARSLLHVPAAEPATPWTLMVPPSKKQARVSLKVAPPLTGPPMPLAPAEELSLRERLPWQPQSESSADFGSKMRTSSEVAADEPHAESPGNLSAAQTHAHVAAGLHMSPAETVSRSYVDNTLLFDTLAHSKPAAYQVAHTAATRISSLKSDHPSAGRVATPQATTKPQRTHRLYDAPPPTTSHRVNDFKYAAQTERLPKSAAQAHAANAKPNPTASRMTPHRVSRIDLTAAKPSVASEARAESTPRDSATSKYAGTAQGMSVSNSRYNRTSFFTSRM